MFRLLAALFACVAIVALVAAGGVALVFSHYGRQLPDHSELASYEPPVTSRVYAGNGRLLAEYASEKRVFVPIDAIPKPVIAAFLAAEDKNFYLHSGIDYAGVVRAVITNIRHYGSDRRPVGASTITQQVAKNFLVGNELSLERKIKEAMLAVQIDRAYSKDRILELYLNEIFLGYGSYGVAAAALNYFNKALDELSIEEIAFLAALPKAPNNYDPARHPAAAKGRRDWVLGRMQEEGYIDAETAARAKAAPLVVYPREATERLRRRLFRRGGAPGGDALPGRGEALRRRLGGARDRDPVAAGPGRAGAGPGPGGLRPPPWLARAACPHRPRRPWPASRRLERQARGGSAAARASRVVAARGGGRPEQGRGRNRLRRRRNAEASRSPSWPGRGRGSRVRRSARGRGRRRTCWRWATSSRWSRWTRPRRRPRSSRSTSR